MTCVGEETRGFVIPATVLAPVATPALLITFAPHDGHTATPSSILVPQILHFAIPLSSD
jgi:hypothetical protein